MSKPFAFLLILIAFLTGNATMLKLAAKFFGEDFQPILADRVYLHVYRTLYGEAPRSRGVTNLKTAYYQQQSQERA